MPYKIVHKRFKNLVIYGLGNQLKTKKSAEKWVSYQKGMYKKNGFKPPEWKITKFKKKRR